MTPLFGRINMKLTQKLQSEVERMTYSESQQMSLRHLPTGIVVSCRAHPTRRRNEMDCWRRLMILLPGQTEEDASKCPKCGSEEVEIGNFVLACSACGWHHLNKYPCTECGKPSFSSVGGSDGRGNSYTYNGCRDHPATTQHLTKAMAGFSKAVLENQRGKDEDGTLPGAAR